MRSGTQVLRTLDQQVFLSSALDSVRQATMVDDDVEHWSGRSVNARGIATLRISLLLGDPLAITRAQLLDGRALLALGPSGVAAVAGQSQRMEIDRLPLRLILTQPNIADEVASLLRYPGSHESRPLQRFVFQSLPTQYRIPVASTIPSTLNCTFDSWRDADGAVAAVSRALSVAGTPARWIDALALRWQRWIESEDALSIAQVTDEGITARDVTQQWRLSGLAAFARRPRAEGVLNDLISRLSDDSDGPEAMFRRGTAYQFVEDRSVGISAEEKACLLRWVDGAYYRSQARQAGGRVLDIEAEAAELRDNLVKPAVNGLNLISRDTLTIHLDRGLVTEVQAMPPELFTIARYRVRQAIAGLDPGVGPTARRQRRRALMTITASLMSELRQIDSLQTWRLLFFKVILTVATAVLLVLDIDTALKILVALLFTVLTLLPEVQVILSSRRRSLERAVRFGVAHDD
jgi:hypothetical protein